jgi:RNA polymerase sigma factor (sigma-70 family)
MTNHQPAYPDRERFEPAPDQISLITQVSTAVARRGRLSPDDVLDFSQHVHVKFAETRYEALRRFDGRSTLRTYLAVVIGRLLLDWRRRESGRWRASAEAERLGPHAVALERFIARDGYSSSEAVELVSASTGAPSRTELWRLVAVLPRRPNRRRVDTPLEDAAVLPFSDAVAALEDEEARKRVWRAVVTAVRQLPPTDRHLLDLRFRQGRRMPEIARILGEQPKRLYSRCSKVLRTLRDAVAASGAMASFEAGPHQRERAGQRLLSTR